MKRISFFENQIGAEAWLIWIALILSALALTLFISSTAAGAYVPVYGGPEDDLGAGTHYYPVSERITVNNAGIAVGDVEKHVDGSFLGVRTFRWNGQGMNPWSYLTSEQVTLALPIQALTI